MAKTTIAVSTIENAAELLLKLQAMIDVAHVCSKYATADTVYITPVKLTLVEEMLSDCSTVYNINVEVL